MFIKDMNWMQVEEYLSKDDRIIVPLGSTEQHAYLSLCTDLLLAENISLEAAEPLGVPVMPGVAFGMTPYFSAYPGTVSLKPATYFALIRDILDSLQLQGFRRILFVNGHGGNSPVAAEIQEWLKSRDEMQVKIHNWWAAPKTMAAVTKIDPIASHASWMENFPITRIEGVTMPTVQKPMINLKTNKLLSAKQVREYCGDGNYGGDYQKDDLSMEKIWQIGVLETREALENDWI
ncbi:creatininase family protein [Oligella urethralis]|uniref:creatininase family protein n=1 Tax=Oligella urethralis TaxID=90245 RepID=UPI00288A36C3|nr:creatininase family protein [Oligella urethralis]